MAQKKKFKTESKELLSLMINSIYSNKEIFLRELISNASDAIDKYRFLSVSSEGKYPAKEHEIRLIVNEAERYLEVRDDGIGMSTEDMEKNLGTIARSGTKEFLAKYQEMKQKNPDADLIGQFGVGFYSAFMVGKRVEVHSLDLEGHASVFSSDGVDTYTIEEDPHPFLTTSGSAVRVYLKDDEPEGENYSDYLKVYTLRRLVKKYSDFIRYPIKTEDTKTVPDLDAEGKPIEGKTHEEKEIVVLNAMTPLWKKAKKDVTDEELNRFYQQRFSDYEDPLLSLNIQAEGMMQYSSLLYIPAHAPYNLYSQNYEKGLALYAKGIFIEEHNKELIPDYLKFVRGLIDSEDLSLNISREMLQKNPVLAKIAKSIEKKILDRLMELKKNDAAKYLEFWKNYGIFFKYGVYSSFGAKKDDLAPFFLFEHFGEERVDLASYKEKVAEGQKYIYYAAGKTLEALKMLPKVKYLQKKGIDVLLCTDDVDEFLFQMMNEYEGLPFRNVNEENVEDASEEEKKQVADLSVTYRRFLDDVKASLGEKVADVSLSLQLEDAPSAISTKEGMSLNMESVLNGNPDVKEHPEDKVSANKVLELNPNHPLFQAFAKTTKEDEVKQLAALLYDEALLSEGYEVEDKAAFLENLNAILAKAYQK